MEWKKRSVERGNLIKLYAFALVQLVAVVVSIPGVVSYFCQFSYVAFLFSGKLFPFEQKTLMKEFD